AKARYTAAKRKSENINNCLNTLYITRTCYNISYKPEFTCYIKDSSYLSDPNYPYILCYKRCEYYI
ncbi:uncharacterized protein K441DRAFT_544184, partial [Cenococcum geophilum 1.58]|uniref:uncharacterized protein n=1 Tax=Cenococcum geophilum 1.58 TaxID=794803 RepID=UPI00358EDF6E